MAEQTQAADNDVVEHGRAQAIAVASVDLFGALMNAAVGAGIVNVAIAALRSDFEPNIKRLKGQVSGLVNSKFRTLTRHDRQALITAAAAAVRSLRIDSKLVRATSNPRVLRALVLERARDELQPVLNDQVTRAGIEAILCIVCDWIVNEIRDAPRFDRQRLNWVIEDVSDHRNRLDEVERQQTYQAARLAEVGALTAAHEQFEALSLVSPTALFSAAVDHRKMPARFVGRCAAQSELTRIVAAEGAAVIAGPELSGRFELARNWSMRERPGSVFALTFSSTAQFSTAVRELAQSRAVDPSGDIATVLARLLWSRPDMTLIVCDLDRADLISRMLSALAPAAGVLLITATSGVVREGISALQLEPLAVEHIHELLETELPAIAAADLADLAEKLEGLPGTARVTAALLRRAGAGAHATLRAISAQPTLALSASLDENQGTRTQEAAWSRSLQHFQTSAAFDGRLLLAAMHVMQHRVLRAQLQAALMLLRNGSPDDGGDAFSDTFVSALHGLEGLDLLNLDGSVVSVHRLLGEHCWRELGEDDRNAVVTSCLQAARSAADHGRYSREVVYYYCAGWLQNFAVCEYRDANRTVFDGAVTQLATMMTELDLRESAVSLLFRLHTLQSKDSAAEAWATSIRIGHLLQPVETRERWLQYVSELGTSYDDSEVILEPEDDCSFWLLVARSRWETGDSDGVLEAVSKGLAMSARLEGASKVLAESGLWRLAGWAQIVRASTTEGIRSLRRGYEVLASVAGTDALEEYRSHTQIFLKERGVLSWRDWRDMAAPKRHAGDPNSVVIGVNSKWVSVAAARSTGELSAARQLLAEGLPPEFRTGDKEIYGIGQFYQILWHAEHLIHDVGIGLESAELERVDVLSMIDDLKAGLRLLETLSPEERVMKRTLGVRNGLLIQSAVANMHLEDCQAAAAFARDAYESDCAIYGPDDAECAIDAIAIADSLCVEAALKGDPAPDEARNWLEVALRIYSMPGSNQNVIEARAVETRLRRP